MPLARQTENTIPPDLVPEWVSASDVEIKIDVFLATLIVYDASEYTF